VHTRFSLEIQIILDDDYLPFSNDYNEVEDGNPTRSNPTQRMGDEKNALLFDSKQLFQGGDVDKKERYVMYVEN
jgi:hypothetical protein